MVKNLLKTKNITNNYNTIINQINGLEEKYKTLSDYELAENTEKLKKQYNETLDLTNIISDSFALIREMGNRRLGLRHFDVQLLGGLVLNDGKIAEIRTGEGKTLVSTLPAYLNALTEKGVQIVTINDYLATRDQNWMGQIHRSLGLTVGRIQENMITKQRQLNYRNDITYVTNSELAFDYLRDNMAFNIQDVVQRPFNYCIIDEVDSILIDEARTPLIISSQTESSTEKYSIAAEVIKYLEVGKHFEIDEKNKNIILSESGIKQVENFLNIKDLYDRSNPWIPFIINALRASILFLKNIQYIIKNNEIIIVDVFTGRIMPDRRWSDGLHQALEAKENVPIRSGNDTLASITYQNFFLLYPKLSGMSGTAKTAELEFEKIYNLPVIVIPTAKKIKRKDISDVIYRDELSKWKAIIKECKNVHLTGQPILIGTTTVEKSEILAGLLETSNLSYQILNAKPENVKKESEIIAQAGKKFAITIASNMAGRGTDIILGGNVKFQIQKELYEYLVRLKSQNKIGLEQSKMPSIIKKEFKDIQSLLIKLLKNTQFLKLNSLQLFKILNELDSTISSNDSYFDSLKEIFNILYKSAKIIQKKDNRYIQELGGLYIIGTERHESRRIDNQLRGRSGRQGDPGITKFFLSLDDSVLRLFASDQVRQFMVNQLLDDIPLESDLLTKSLNKAQSTLENRNYDFRKKIFDYDEVLDKQRRLIFSERRNILEGNSIRQKIIALGEQIITDIINENRELEINKLNSTLLTIVGTSLNLKAFLKKNNNIYKRKELEFYLIEQFWLAYELKEAEVEIIEIGVMREIERVTILKYIDILWKEHLQNISLMRDAVGWRSYGQRNPLFEYKDEAYTLFNYLIKSIRQLIIYELLNIKPI